MRLAGDTNPTRTLAWRLVGSGGTLVLAVALLSSLAATAPDSGPAPGRRAAYVVAGGLFLAMAALGVATVRQVFHLGARTGSAALQPALLAGSALLLVSLAWLQLPRLVRLVPTLLRPGVAVYALAVAADYAHRWRSGRAIWASTLPWVMGLLPIALIGGCYLLLAAAFGLDPARLERLLFIGLTVAFFNLGAVTFAGGPPLDGGMALPDGRRLLGPGKTVGGSLGGLLLSALVYGLASGAFWPGWLIGLLALGGDAGASFLKRRAGLRQGEPVLLLDQLDGILPLLLLECAAPCLGVTATDGLILLLATVLVQAYGNALLHRLRRKTVPY